MKTWQIPRTGWGLAVILALGYLPVHVMISLFIASWWSSLAEVRYGRNIVVRRSGEVNFQRYEPGLRDNPFLMLDGTPRPVALNPDQPPLQLAEQMVSTAVLPGSAPDEVEEALPLQRVMYAPTGNWFARQDGAGSGGMYLEGYDWRTRRRIGFLSARGLTETRPESSDRWQPAFPGESNLSRQFEGVHHNHRAITPLSVSGNKVLNVQRIPEHLIYLAAADGVWEADLASHRTRRISDIKGLRAIRRIEMIPAELDQSQTLSVDSLLLATRDKLIVLDPLGNRQWEYPLPEGMSPRGVAVASIADGGLVLYQYLHRSGRYDNTHIRLWWLDKSGEVTRQEETAPQPPPDGLFDRPGPQGIAMGMSVPVPLIAAISAGVALWTETSTPPEHREFSIDPDTPILVAGFSALTCLVGAACAVLAIRRARQVGGVVPWQWGLFALVLGLPGLIGLLYAKRRPELAQCEWLRGEPLVVPPKLSTDLFAA